MVKASHVLLIALVSVLVFCVTTSGVEAKSKKYSLSARYTDYCSGYGKHGEKITTKIHNPQNELLGKKTFKFKDVLKKNKVSITFSKKDTLNGDRLKIDTTGTVAKGNGEYSETHFIDFSINKIKYSDDISIEDFGC